MTSNLKKELQSKLTTPLELGEVLSAFYRTFPNEENYDTVLIKSGNQTILNIPALLLNTRAEQVIIQFEKRISEQDLELLIPVANGLRDAIYHDDKMMEIPVELEVDYADFWHNQFDWFRIREIKRNYYIQLGQVLSFAKILPEYYLGKNYPLKIVKKQSKNSIEFVNGEFVFRLKSSRSSNDLIQKLYQDWLIENAQYLFKDKVEEYSQKLGVKSKRIAIKKLKDRWGSITKDDLINLNVNLLKAPEDVIDYIILHELCHLRIKEHPHHYWSLI